MLRYMFLLAMLALPGLANAAPLALHRGVGVHNLLNWSPVAADGNYRWPPYRSEAEWLGEYRPLSDWPAGSAFAHIKSLGFDFVRMTLDPGPLLANTGDRRREALAVIEAAVRGAVAQGLKVVLNFHPTNQFEAYSPKALHVRPDDPAVVAYRGVVAETAAMLLRVGIAEVAIEPFNEPAYYPCDAGGSEDFQQVLERQVAAIRAVSAELTIVVTGACGGSITGLTDLVPSFDDDAILYSLHMYEPHSFSHQRADNGGWFSGFPWPASAGSREAVLEGLRTRMDAAGVGPIEKEISMLVVGGEADKYFAMDWGLPQMEARLAEAVDWAARYDIPPSRLFMGEFGAILMTADGRSGAFDADRLRYLGALREIADRHGIPWSIWEYSNPYGMSLIVPEGPAGPDLPLLGVLGLEPIR